MRIVALFVLLVLTGFTMPANADYKVEKSYGLVTHDSQYLDGELDSVVTYKLKFPDKLKNNPEYENIVMESVNQAVGECRNEANQLISYFDDFITKNFVSQESSLVRNIYKNAEAKFRVLELNQEDPPDLDKVAEAIEKARALTEEQLAKEIESTRGTLVAQYETLVKKDCNKKIEQAIEAGWEEVKKQKKEYKDLKLKVDRELRKANWKIAGGVFKIIAGTVSASAGVALTATGGATPGGVAMIVGGGLGIIKGGVDIAKASNEKAKAVAQLKPDLEKAAVNIRNAKAGMEEMLKAIQEEMTDAKALSGIMKQLKPLVLQAQSEVENAQNELGRANDQNRAGKQQQLEQARAELNKQYKQAYDAQKLFMEKYFGTGQVKTSVAQLKTVQAELTNYKAQSGLLLKQINTHSLEAENLMKDAVKLEAELRKLINKTEPKNKKQMEKVNQAQEEMKAVLKKLNQVLMTIEGERKWRKQAAQFAAEVEEEAQNYGELLKKYQDSMKAVTLDTTFSTGPKVDTSMSAFMDWMSSYGNSLNDILSAAASVTSTAAKVETEYGLLTTALDILTSFIGV